MYIEQMCKFGILILGEVENFVQVGSSHVSGSARRFLSPTCEYCLGTVMRAVCA